MKTIANHILSLLLAVVTLSGFTACNNDDVHENERGTAVAIDNSSCRDVAIGQTKLCIYDASGKFCAAYDFADAQSIASTLLPLQAGHYTLAVVVNADEPLTETATLTALHEWVASAADMDGDLLSGVADADVKENGLTRVVLPLRRGAFPLPVLCVRFAFPETAMADFAPTRAKARASKAGHALRCVAELCENGTDQVVLHKAVTPQLQEDGTYTIELQLSEGDYDLRLWADHANADAPLADTYYLTGSLKAVSIATEPYMANTDAKDAAYGNESNITVAGDTTTVTMTLQRPLAKYKIIANDVETYRILMELEPENYPPLEELTVTVQYEGYLPSEFNALKGVVTDATTGMAFSAMPTDPGLAATELPLVSDWIMAGGESSVTVTLTVCDSNGNKVSSVSGVTIAYKQGCQTTVTGKFLTAGVNVGGVTIEPDWDEVIIEF